MSDIVLKLYDSWDRTNPTVAHTLYGDVVDYMIEDRSNSEIDTAWFKINDSNNKWSGEINPDHWTGSAETTQVWRAFSRSDKLLNSGVVSKVSKKDSYILLEGRGVTELLKRHVVLQENFHSDVSGDYVLLDSTYGLIPQYLSSSYGAVTTDKTTPTNTSAKGWKFDGVSLYDSCVDVARNSYGANGYIYEVYLYETYDSATNNFTLKCYFKEVNSAAISKTLRMSDIYLPGFNYSEHTSENYNQVVVRGKLHKTSLLPKDGDLWTESLDKWWGRIDDPDNHMGVFLTATDLHSVGDWAVKLSRDAANEQTNLVLQNDVIMDFKSTSDHQFWVGGTDTDAIGEDYYPSTIAGDLVEEDDATEKLFWSDEAKWESSTNNLDEWVYYLFKFDVSEWVSDMVGFAVEIEADGGGSVVYDQGYTMYGWNDTDKEWDSMDSSTTSYKDDDVVREDEMSGWSNYVRSNCVYILLRTRDKANDTDYINLDVDAVKMEIYTKDNHLIDNRYHSIQFNYAGTAFTGEAGVKEFYVTLGMRDRRGYRLRIKEDIGHQPVYKLAAYCGESTPTTANFIRSPTIPLPKPDQPNGWINAGVTDMITNTTTPVGEWDNIHQLSILLNDSANTEIQHFWIDGFRFIGDVYFEGKYPTTDPTIPRMYFYQDSGLDSDEDCVNMAENIKNGLDLKQYSISAPLMGVKRDFDLKAGDTAAVYIPSKAISEASQPIESISYTPNKQTLNLGRSYSQTEIINRVIRKTRMAVKGS